MVMSSQADAVKATQMFNGYNLGDREMKVGPAKAREDTGRASYPGKGGDNRGIGRPVTHKSRGGAHRY